MCVCGGGVSVCVGGMSVCVGECGGGECVWCLFVCARVFVMMNVE